VAMMPMIDTTISNSINVNPDCRRISSGQARFVTFVVLYGRGQIRAAAGRRLTKFARCW
jgi:hypothetical protein